MIYPIMTKTWGGKIKKDLTGSGSESVIKHMRRELGIDPPLKKRRR
jgi:hypothetical protein